MVESVPWSAEEFEGELVDRVRRTVESKTLRDESDEAVAGGRAKADRPRLYETDSLGGNLEIGQTDTAEEGGPEPHSLAGRHAGGDRG